MILTSSIQAYVLAFLFKAIVAITSLLAFANLAISEEFSGRLSPNPVTLRDVDVITGSGEVIATLNANSLTVQGRFAGLQGAATEAFLHAGKRAIPGPAFAQLSVDNKTAGEVSGVIELSEQQLETLRAGGIYLQINSEAAPTGNLRAWLLTPQNTLRQKNNSQQNKSQ